MVNDVVQLLSEKNQFLENFFQLNESEILNFNLGDFDNLENFYQARESILELIQKIDKKIETSNSQFLSERMITDIDRKKMVECLNFKNEIIPRILAQDLHILSLIETAKSLIIKELTSMRSAKKALRGYRLKLSTNNLDEKA